MHTLRLLFLLLPVLIFTQCSREDEIIQNTNVTQFQNQEGVSFLVIVKDEEGNPLNNVTLTDNLSGASHSSDQQGVIVLEDMTVPVGGLPISLEKTGWMKAIKRLKGMKGSRKTVEIMMTHFDMESQIQTGGSGDISGGGKLSLPATLLGPDNNVYTGPVTVKSYHYNPAREDFLQTAPGDMTAIGIDGENYTLESYGMYAIELFDDAGNELDIPSGETAQIQFPIANFQKATAPAEIPLWSMDEDTGKWIEEGTANRNGDIYIAEVSHFSWWNCDVPFTAVDVCMQLVDLNDNPVPNFTYLVSSPDLQTFYAQGTSDQNGDICVGLPEGMPVVIRILVNDALSAPTDLGTFSEPADIGEVVINVSLKSVEGKAVDCNGTQVPNAIVRTKLNGNTGYSITDDAGNFHISFNETGQLLVQIFNYDEFQESEEISLQLVQGQTNYEAGEITVCQEFDSDVIPIVGNIFTDQTWVSGKTYLLLGRIVVLPGATLTIEPGVVVKGQPGEGAEASMLWVAQGGKLIAEGTAASPIIFTSSLDDIEPGMLNSPNLTSSDIGLWGGILLLGEAPVSVEFPDPTIEGIPASDPYITYGGDNPDDNSGTLRYVSIRHCGANIGAGNETDGLTLAGVGSGTTIENIEIAASLDDGISFYGGNVDVKHAIFSYIGDDALDIDQAYDGTVDNFIFIGGPIAPRALELDGPEGTMNAGGKFILKNGSLKGGYTDYLVESQLAGFRNDAKGTLENCYFFDFSPLSTVELRDDEDSANYLSGEIKIIGNEFNLAVGQTLDQLSLDSAPNGDDAAFDLQFASENSAVSSPSVGADKTVFVAWTWADTNGKLNDF
jgi:hypothetical protein